MIPQLALPPRAHPVLVTRPLLEPLVERTTGLLLRRGITPSPAAKTLIALLTEQLEKPAASRILKKSPPKGAPLRPSLEAPRPGRA